MANRLSLAIRVSGLDVNEEESMTEHDKLVRDRIPEIVRAHATDLEFRSLEPAERPLRLTDKLAEECTEYQESGEIGELVDVVEVVEVVHAIVAASGLTWEVFEEMRLAKRAARGGFDDGVLLIRAER